MPIRTIPIGPHLAAELVRTERWTSRTEPQPDGCIRWAGSWTTSGYGQLFWNGRLMTAHRIAYVAAAGADIPPGLVIDHMCRNRLCVNPQHLRAVTNRDNMLADGSMSISAIHHRQTHCKRGHPLTPDNMRSNMPPGQRGCSICNVQWARDREELIKRARTLLGLTYEQYRAEHGGSIGAARAIIERVAP